MKDLLNRMFLTGLGLASMTRDKIEEVAERISKESKLTEEEGKKLLDELLKKSEDAKNEIEAKIEEKLEVALNKLKLVKAEEVEKLKAEIEKLKAELENLRNKE